MTDSNYTHLAIIADRSGSMWGLSNDMNGGIEALLQEQNELPGDLLVDVTVFDHLVEHRQTNVLPGAVNFPIITPRGSTSLYDAIGSTVQRLGERLEALDEDKRPGKVIVVVITDGQENTSKEWKADAVKKLVTKQREEFSWEFLFLGANIDSFSVGGGLGFAAGSTMNYTPSAAGVQSMTRSMSNYLADTRSGLDTEFSEADRLAAAATKASPDLDAQRIFRERSKSDRT